MCQVTLDTHTHTKPHFNAQTTLPSRHYVYVQLNSKYKIVTGVTPQFQRDLLHRVPAPTRSLELVTATLVNACDFIRGATAHFRSVPEVALHSARLKIHAVCF